MTRDAAAGRMEFHVAPGGADGWSGTRSRPGRTDGPFATLERAQEAVRALAAAGRLPPGGVTVRVQPGDYRVARPLVLGPGDSGTAGAPVTWRAASPGRARLLGGCRIPRFEPVADPRVLARLAEPARPHVVQADLRALGIDDFGRLRSRGFGRPAAPAHAELFVGGRPMTLARWPNGAFTTLAGIGAPDTAGDGHGGRIGRLDAGFLYEGDRPRRWARTDRVWVHGYWAWDWANSYEEVASIDVERRLVLTAPPHGLYGFRAGQRFYFLNVLEELDEPGEYYVDADAGVLYAWLPDGAKDAEALVSVLEAPMLTVRGASHVRIQGFVLECTRGEGIRIEGGEDVRVEGCALRGIGTHGIVISGGRRHRVASCDISETGDSGIEVSGGDRLKLEPCGHEIVNNHVWRFARWSRCYRPAVRATGCGITIRHNLFHDAPHTAVLYQGNDILIELNEIHHVTLETGDCGAIYTGRDFTARGNTIRHNFIHHTGGVGMGSMGVYFDDCVSGQRLEANIFWRVHWAAFIGGGRDIAVVNNVFVDCDPAIHVDGRGLDGSPTWSRMIRETMKESLDAVKPHEPPYRERYPELAALDAYYAAGAGVPPEGNTIERNIAVGGWLEVTWHAKESHLALGPNLVGDDPLFADAAHGDFRLKPGSPAFKLGFSPIPVARIGLQRDRWRKSVARPAPGDGAAPEEGRP